MRRGRNLREHRQKLLKERAETVAQRRKKVQNKLAKKQNLSPQEMKERRDARIKQLRKERSERLGRPRTNKKEDKIDLSLCPAASPSGFKEFISYDDYSWSSPKTANVIHLIDSLGLGGAQTMMAELVNSMNKYYGDHSNNYVICANYRQPKYDKKLYGSYNIKPIHCKTDKLKKFCEKNSINTVIHHRTALSSCVKPFLPASVKYILVNHTWHNMWKLQDFMYCDYYVSVCKFLRRKSRMADFIDSSRNLTILNGIENDYLDDIPTSKLEGKFKTGRCHRLVPSKFRPDSLQWMIGKVMKVISGYHHYIMGTSSQAKVVCNKSKQLHYMGTVRDRNKKMSNIKALDVYFYETFQDEGASVAILESLACGVPVICKPLGGCTELVTDNVNGFVVKERGDYLDRMRKLNNNRAILANMKKRTLEDFNDRLHVKHTACKYMQLIEYMLNEKQV